MIGIPIVGIYLAQRLLKKDFAQSIIITSLGTSLFLPEVYGTLSSLGLADMANYADKASISAAFASSVLGTYLEMKKKATNDYARVVF